MWQLGRLFDRASMVVSTQPMLAIERRASNWWLSTFRHKRFDDESTGDVREQEWSLADRETLLFGGSPLRLLLQSELAGSLPEGQKRLARAVLSSVPGIYRVVERGDHHAVFEDLNRDRRIEAHEHNDEADYGAGSVAIGRLYPLERWTHVRSPGMVILPREDGLAESLCGILRDAPPDLPPAASIEAVLCSILRGSTKPRRILPARNPSEAHDLLHTLIEHLEEEGLAHEAAEDDVEIDPGWAAEVDPSTLAYRRFDVDVAVGGWMTALMDQAKLRGRSERETTGGRKGGTGKKRAAARKSRRRRKRS